MADSGSSEEVAVIGNTDITSAESENNIINTVVLLVILCDRNVWEFLKKSLVSLAKTFPKQAQRNRGVS